MQGLLRRLEMVRRQLAADDARVEIGGEAPEDPRLIHAEIRPGWRLVVVFSAPLDDPEEARTRLAALAITLQDELPDGRGAHQPAEGAGEPPPRGQVGRGVSGQRARIEDELARVLQELRARTGAEAALVIDDASPVLWASSEPPVLLDVDEAWRVAELARRLGDPVLLARLVEGAPLAPQPPLDGPGAIREDAERSIAALSGRHRELDPDRWARTLRIARSVALVRAADHEGEGITRLVDSSPELGVLARSFAGIYRLVQVFPGTFSELSAEGPTTRALPVIERLMLSLPPIDPMPRGGRKFAPLRSVD